MCGIAGAFGPVRIPDVRIAKTKALMRNRGPDHQGSTSLLLGNNIATVINARLAILDLDARSNQPFRIGACTMVYNGEIYNFRELRKELEKEGVEFRTESDTEVVLQSYLRNGEKCVDRFEGMWAFAIVDEERGQLFLSRDRFGEKPLYYTVTPEGFIFGSEIKFLSTLANRTFSVNERHLCRFLVNGYKSLYKTQEQYFNDVAELPRASNMVVDGSLRRKEWQYWNPSWSIAPMSLNDAICGVRERLLRSVELRLRADVPLAFCLSGGVDSNAITAIAAKRYGCDVTTFSIIDSDPRYDERALIQSTLADLQCPHYFMELKPANFFDRLRDLVSYHDAPIPTTTYFVHAFLTEEIGRRGFKVALSGTAADEIFTGYYDHFLLHLAEVGAHPEYPEFRKGWEREILPLVRNPVFRNPDLYREKPQYREHIFPDAKTFEGYLRKPFHEAFAEREIFPGTLLRNRMLNELFYENTPLILHEDDLNSMRFSVENRSPFLDTELVKFCFSIPPEYLIRNGYGKYLLREALDGIVNDTVRWNRRKQGFNASLNSLVNLKDPTQREYILADSPIYSVVKKECIAPHLDLDPMPDGLNRFLFAFLSAKVFLEQHGS